MFQKSNNRRRGAPLPFTIFRLLVSLTLFLILGIALIQAYKYFSGNTLENDPITRAINQFPSDPKGAVKELLTSEDTANMIGRILSFSPVSGLKLPISNTAPAVENNNSNVNQNSGPALFKFAIVADSHNNNEDLAKALVKAKSMGIKFVIGLGDFSEVGTIQELSDAKQIFDNGDLPYYVIPGDHDLWDARDKGKPAVSNFNQVFGVPYQAFSDSNIRFILLYNSDNYNGVDDLQFNWLGDELSKLLQDKNKSIYIFLHEPVAHPTSDQTMGSPRKTGEAGSARKSDPGVPANTKIQEQAKELLDKFKKANVVGIFAGDIHAFTSYIDTTTNLNMATAGALSKERNTEAPGFAAVDVFQDGSYNITDIKVNNNE